MSTLMGHTPPEFSEEEKDRLAELFSDEEQNAIGLAFLDGVFVYDTDCHLTYEQVAALETLINSRLAER